MKVFLSNTYDPKQPDWEIYVARSFCETHAQAVENYRVWLRGKQIGEPRPSKTHNIAKMKEMHLVGVYMDVGIAEYIRRALRGWL